MKAKFLASLLLVLLPSILFGLTTADLNRVINTSSTLENLSATAAAGQPLPAADRFVVLTGVVASIQVIDQKPASFQAEIRLIEGQWHGLQSVSLYQCTVQVAGPAFAPRFPARPPAGIPDPRLILVNQQVMVIGTVSGVRTEVDGTRLPVITGLYIRSI